MAIDSLLLDRPAVAAHVARTLLTQPAQSNHIVQFYEDDAFLAGVVAEFIGAGLDNGEPVLIVATAAHRAAFRQRLEADGYDVAAAERAGELLMLDARESLATFMSGGLPSRARFERVAGEALDRVTAGTCHARVRAYGEMVDLLWRDGQPQAAIRLEELWNDLARRREFSLLCAYSMANFADEAQAQAFREVCCTHTHVIPTEKFSALAESDARLREVTLLQQRALTLEREIEQRKQAEEALRDVLAQREEFLAIAGHELKTPVTSVQLVLQSLVPLTKDGDPRIRSRLEKAARGVGRLARLADELLDVGRLQAGRLELSIEEVDLAAVVRECIDGHAELLATAGCRTIISSDPRVSGRWDRLRLEQVIGNLLSNAAKYGRNAPIEISVEARGDCARVVVRDQGAGIEPENQTRIFDRFERAASRDHYGGLGLGLYIARQVVEAHAGTIRVESTPGRGAAFIVELPVAPNDRARTIALA